MNWVRHGGSTTFETKVELLTTWFQTSRYCRAKVEFNSIKWVRHGSSTTFETGLSGDFLGANGQATDKTAGEVTSTLQKWDTKIKIKN